jgi:hypothetical protein
VALHRFFPLAENFYNQKGERIAPFAFEFFSRAALLHRPN